MDSQTKQDVREKFCPLCSKFINPVPDFECSGQSCRPKGDYTSGFILKDKDFILGVPTIQDMIGKKV